MTVRSPTYPSIPLHDAIVRASALFDAERHNPISREAAAKLLGYSGLTGGSNKMLADLASYGLIQRVGKGEIRVSNRVAALIHPANSEEYERALQDAALEPKLFSELRERFPDHLPTDGNLEGVLVRMGFSKAGTRPAKKAFLETFGYLEKETGTESHGEANKGAAELVSPSSQTTFGGASVDDFVQWESHGALQFETPRRVRWVSDDGDWLAVEGSDTGIPMNQAILQDAPASAVPPQTPPPAETAKQEVVKEGQRKAVFPVSEGDVTFIFPKGMTLEGIEELEAYLAVFLKKEKRNAQSN